jgi:hypothetical protein
MSAEVETPATKPGYKTTEFWLALASQVVSILLASGLIETGSSWDQIIGIVASVLTALGYGVARGIAKRG